MSDHKTGSVRVTLHGVYVRDLDELIELCRGVPEYADLTHEEKRARHRVALKALAIGMPELKRRAERAKGG